jgi:hypothetical protein
MIQIWKSAQPINVWENYEDSPNVTRALKSRRMRQAEHVACMVEMIHMYRILVRKPEG